MRIIAALAVTLTLAGCADQSAAPKWSRVDGKPVADAQFRADHTQCVAEAYRSARSPPSNNTVIVERDPPQNGPQFIASNPAMDEYNRQTAGDPDPDMLAIQMKGCIARLGYVSN
jgi:hypothetical protein